jgi:periplasmic copper chaperone A
LRTRLSAAILGASLTALALPAFAAAHVTLQPTEAPANAFVVENVRVPNEESKANTTKVSVQFPDGFGFVSYEPVPGWNVEMKREKLSKPIKTEDGEVTEQVTQVTFSGGEIAPGQFLDLPLSMQMPDKAGSKLTFKATQTYDNGKVVRWIGPPGSEEPAPQVEVTAAEGEHASTTAATSASDDDEDDDSNGLAIAALIVGGLGLLAGGAALVTRRRT